MVSLIWPIFIPPLSELTYGIGQSVNILTDMNFCDAEQCALAQFREINGKVFPSHDSVSIQKNPVHLFYGLTGPSKLMVNSLKWGALKIGV